MGCGVWRSKTEERINSVYCAADTHRGLAPSFVSPLSLFLLLLPPPPPPCVSPSFCSDRGTVSDHSLPTSRDLISQHIPTMVHLQMGIGSSGECAPTHISGQMWAGYARPRPCDARTSILGHAASTWDDERRGSIHIVAFD